MLFLTPARSRDRQCQKGGLLESEKLFATLSFKNVYHFVMTTSVFKYAGLIGFYNFQKVRFEILKKRKL